MTYEHLHATSRNPFGAVPIEQLALDMERLSVIKRDTKEPGDRGNKENPVGVGRFKEGTPNNTAK